MPPGACDTHFHFFGPRKVFPFNAQRGFVPDVDHEDSTIDDWLAMQTALGLSRGLLVQSMMYYPSYEIVLHGLSREPARLRAVVLPGITDAELSILDKAGVVGLRFTLPTGKTIDERLVKRAHERGWECTTFSMTRNMRRLSAHRCSPRPGSSSLSTWETPQFTRASKARCSNSSSTVSTQVVAGSSFRHVYLCKRRFRSPMSDQWSMHY